MRSIDAHDRHRRDAPFPESSYVEKAIGLVLLLILAVGCALVLAPFVHAILLAVTLCVSTWALYRRAERAMGGRRTLAALLMTSMAAILLLVPLVLLASNLVEDATRLNASLRTALEQGLPPPRWLSNLPFVGDEAERMWEQASRQGKGIWPLIEPYAGPIRDWVLRQGSIVLTGTFQVALSIVLAFFLYRDGAYVEARLESAMSRLAGWRARQVLQTAGATIKSVVNGVLGTALLQGILMGFSLWLAGVPGAVLLGAFGIVLTLLPLGLIVVWLPVAVWLMSEGHTGLAVFVMVWNGLFVGSLDNVLRPYLIKRGSDLPTALIFLGVLGGVLAFGIVGVVLGPVLLAVAHTLFQNWGRTARAAADNLDHSQCGGAASVASSSEGESA